MLRRQATDGCGLREPTATFLPEPASGKWRRRHEKAQRRVFRQNDAGLSDLTSGLGYRVRELSVESAPGARRGRMSRNRPRGSPKSRRILRSN